MSEDSSKYRNFSEMSYMFDSGLYKTTAGIEKLILRTSLFEKTKQHLPYVFMIHSLLYHDYIPADERRILLKKILLSVKKDILIRSDQNTLFDFMPAFYAFQLLVELHFQGYHVNSLLNKKLYWRNNEIKSLWLYSNFKEQGRIKTFLHVLFKLGLEKRQLDEIIHRIAMKEALNHNLTNFYILIKKINSIAHVDSLKQFASIGYSETGDTRKAKKTALSIKDPLEQAIAFELIARTLADLGYVKNLNGLMAFETSYANRISLAFGLVRFYVKSEKNAKASAILTNALKDLNNIADAVLKERQSVLIMDMALKADNLLLLESLTENLLGSYSQDSKKDEDNAIIQDIFQMYLDNGRPDLLNALLKKHLPLKSIDRDMLWGVMQSLYIEMHLLTKGDSAHDDKLCDEYYQKVEKALKYISADEKEGCLFDIAYNKARNGFYSQAVKTRDLINVKAEIDLLNFAMALMALEEYDIQQALEFSNQVEDESDRLSLQLCLTPNIEVSVNYELALEMIKGFYIYCYEKV